MIEPAFELVGVTISSADQRLLDDVNLSLPVGESLVVSGVNGAGKSTLLRAIRGSIAPTSGIVTTLGCQTPLPAPVARKVTAVLDEPAFWPWMTARGVLRTVLNLNGKELNDEDQFLADVGLDDPRLRGRRAKKVKAYSQGMRKRLQVACALAMGGELLLVDEPTSSLDVDGAATVWAALLDSNRRGATLVVASHDPDAAQVLGARQIEMRYGQVAREQPAGSVF